MYASNRGFDPVAVFSSDPTNGRLTAIEYTRSGGRTPSFFELDPAGRLMFVANEDNDTIVTFAGDGASGELTKTDDAVNTGSPVCIVFRPAG